MAGFEDIGAAYSQRAHPSRDASPAPSSDHQSPADARVLAVWPAVICREFLASKPYISREWISLRCSISLRQDIPILEILGIWAHLKMLLERLLALDGREGRLVDIGVGGFIGHVEVIWGCR